MSDILFLNAEEVRRALPMDQAIAGTKEAYRQLSASQATVPLRSHLDVPAYAGVSLIMPAYLAESHDLAVKIVSVYPENVKRDEPVIYAVVIVLDATNGRPVALLEGGALTAIRTGAASGAATDLLARDDAEVVAIFGSGVQARTQLEAVCTVRSISSVRVYSLNRHQALEFAESMADYGPIPDAIDVVQSPAEALAGAEIICTATTSNTPVFDGRDLEPGCHVNAIGAFTPQMQEVDVQTIRRSLVVVDSREAVMEEAGDLLVPLAKGEIDESHIYAELGEIVAGRKPGRTNPEQITYFKSVGVAVQDAVAGRIALQNARAGNLGSVVSL
jgi:ornithine cyclodeaminase/alanine dehydrogenase-like protein (mu-crystallin family)